MSNSALASTLIILILRWPCISADRAGRLGPKLSCLCSYERRLSLGARFWLMDRPSYLTYKISKNRLVRVAINSHFEFQEESIIYYVKSLHARIYIWSKKTITFKVINGAVRTIKWWSWHSNNNNNTNDFFLSRDHQCLQHWVFSIQLDKIGQILARKTSPWTCNPWRTRRGPQDIKRDRFLV